MFVNLEKCEQNWDLLSKIGQKKRIAGKKNSKIDSSLDKKLVRSIKNIGKKYSLEQSLPYLSNHFSGKWSLDELMLHYME